MTVGLDRSPLGGSRGSDTGTAHSYFHNNRLQMVFLFFFFFTLLIVVTELPLQKHSLLYYGDWVVVVALHWESLVLGWVAGDQDASWTQALSLGVGGRKVILLCYKSGKEQGDPMSSLSKDSEEMWVRYVSFFFYTNKSKRSKCVFWEGPALLPNLVALTLRSFSSVKVQILHSKFYLSTIYYQQNVAEVSK